MKICACVNEKTKEEVIKSIKLAMQQGADLVELRMDKLENQIGVEEIIQQSPLPLIATYRMKKDEKTALDGVLKKAIEAGAAYVDVDIGEGPELSEKIVTTARKKGCKVICSSHDFQKTPSKKELEELVQKMKKKCDVVKIVTTANRIEDCYTVLEICKGNRGIIAFCMGDVGKFTRMLCLACGSPWTYCKIKEETAAGQYTIKEMKEFIKSLQKTKTYAVIGNPIKHSKSPEMHNAALKAAEIDGKYIKLRILRENLEDAIDGLRRLGIAGLNVTIPHKIEIMKYLDDIDEVASNIGAVNTVANENGRLIGYNTDGYGALESINAVSGIEGKRIVMVGAGGAARAIAFTIATKANPKEISITDRKSDKAKKLVQEIKEKTNANVTVFSLEEKEKISDAGILINCTPVGMHPKINESPVDATLLRKNMIVFDIVYNPVKTKLIQDAEEAGCRTITGENMLILQGVKAFEIWTGKKPDIETMRKTFHQKESKTEKNIVLLGFMGTGKTTVGKILAKKLKKKLVDLDSEIEKEAGMKIKEIFEQHGERKFRELEVEITKKYSEERGLVLSCGGGVVLNIINLARLSENSDMFLLTATPSEIVKRVRDDSDRPLLGQDEEKKKNAIKRILESRKGIYTATGATEIKTDGLSPEKVTDKIIECLGDGHE